MNFPQAIVGWWRMNESMYLGNTSVRNPNCQVERLPRRQFCPMMVPCEPLESCIGNNMVRA